MSNRKVSEANPESVRKFLNNGSLYYQTLTHPESVFGVKVPDGVDDDTSTFCEVYRVSGAANSHGVFSMLVGVPAGGGAISSGFSSCSLTPGGQATSLPLSPGTVDTTWHMMAVTSSSGASTDSGLFGYDTTVANKGAPATTTYRYVILSHPVQSLVVANYRLLRPVSAGMLVESTSSQLYNSGTMTIAPLGRLASSYFMNLAGTDWTETPSITTTSKCMNWPGAITVSTAAHQSIHAFWKPMDNACLEFTDTLMPAKADTNHVEWSRHDAGGFWFVASGCAASAPFFATVVINYEAVPMTSSYMPTSPPAVDDPIAISEARNELATITAVKAGSGSFSGITDTASEVMARGTTITCPTMDDPAIQLYGSVISFAKPDAGILNRKRKGGSKKKGRSNPRNYRPVKESQSSSMFEDMLGYLLPLAEKALPFIMAAI